MCCVNVEVYIVISFVVILMAFMFYGCCWLTCETRRINDLLDRRERMFPSKEAEETELDDYLSVPSFHVSFEDEELH